MNFRLYLGVLGSWFRLRCRDRDDDHDYDREVMAVFRI